MLRMRRLDHARLERGGRVPSGTDRRAVPSQTSCAQTTLRYQAVKTGPEGLGYEGDATARHAAAIGGQAPRLAEPKGRREVCGHAALRAASGPQRPNPGARLTWK